MARLIDFSASLVDPQAIKDAGYAGVIGYFSDRRPGAEWMQAKPLTREYCDQLRALGLEVVTNFQFAQGGNDTSDWTGGFDAGVRNATCALELHTAAGGPDNRPLYCAIDSAPTLDMWNTTVVEYVRGWASVVGLERTGIYANADMIDNAIEDGVATWFWQHNNLGYASDHPDHPAAHIHQVRIDQDSVAGVGVDVNITLKDDYGQWSKAVASPPDQASKAATLQDPTTRVQLSPNCNEDDSRDVTWIAIHTQQGNGTAASLTNYLCNPDSQVSYNAVTDDTETVLVVPWDTNPWSAVNANGRADHICMAGTFVAWDRGKWLSTDDSDGVDEDVMLTRTAELVAWRCLERGIPIEYVGGGSQPPDRPGICGHVDFGQWGGGHTDPGDNFPWDELIRRAQAFAAGAGGDDLSFANETIKNKAGQDINAGEMIAYLDLHINQIKYALALVLEQFAGRDAATNFLDNEIDPKPAVAFNGWQQGGGRTLYDLSAATAAKNGVAGTADTKAPK